MVQVAEYRLPVPPEVAPRLRQYLDWLEVSGAEVLGAEFQVWNLTIGYAGTVDLLVRFRDGSIWVIDLKTGKGLYGEHALQLIDVEFYGRVLRSARLHDGSTLTLARALSRS